MDAETDKRAQPKILLVDDHEPMRDILKDILETSRFCVSTAANVSEAIHLIDTEPFDVLLSDLHMPGAGDGFTVISAMRHKQPNAITLLLTGYPALEDAMDAIRLQADEILLKPMPIPELVALIREKLGKRATRQSFDRERVASILERDAHITIVNWLAAVNSDDELNRILLSAGERT
jgi:DNA-binding NtrC family response regulator